MEHKPLFEVKYWEDAFRFLQKIDEVSRVKILENIDKARYALDPKLLKKLTGEIWEFRTKYAGIQYRLLAFWDKRDRVQTLVIATHGSKRKPRKRLNRKSNGPCGFVRSITKNKNRHSYGTKKDIYT